MTTNENGSKTMSLADLKVAYEKASAAYRKVWTPNGPKLFKAFTAAKGKDTPEAKRAIAEWEAFYTPEMKALYIAYSTARKAFKDAGGVAERYAPVRAAKVATDKAKVPAAAK